MSSEAGHSLDLWAELAEVEQLVAQGDYQAALQIILNSAFSCDKWRAHITAMTQEAEDPDTKSTYRHLLAALYFDQGDVDGARFMLEEDLRREQTSAEFKSLSRRKLQELG